MNTINTNLKTGVFPLSAPSAASLSTRSYYCSIIALNNYGVTLLQQGKFLYAKDTFQDAIHVVHTVVSSIDDPFGGTSIEASGLGSSMSSGVSPLKSIIDARVQKAFLQTLFPSDMNQPLSPISLKVVTHSLCGTHTLQSLTEVRNHDQYLHHQIGGLNVQKIAFPIKMDVDEDDYLLKDLELEFESAIILHNIGLAYLCLANTQSNDSSHQQKIEQERVVNHAIKSLRLAQSVLQDLSSRPDIYSSSSLTTSGGIEVLNRSLNLESIVLYTLIEFLLITTAEPSRDPVLVSICSMSPSSLPLCCKYRSRHVVVTRMILHIHEKLKPLFGCPSTAAGAA